MNSRGLIQILTGAIVILLGAVGYLAYVIASRPPASPAQVNTVTNTVRQIAVRKINPTNFFPNVSIKMNWAGIESTNYQTYIANLRDIGCPEETIRDIIITDIAKLYARRRAALRAQVPYRFWQTGDPLQNDSGGNRELQRQLQELDREQRTMVKQLLGVDFRAEMSRYYFDETDDQRMYGFLPAEKQGEVKALLSRFDEMEQEIYSRSKGLLLDADQEQLRRIEQLRESELAGVLSPAELEEYQLRNSSTANSMRAQLGSFSPNEEEFRKIFRLQKVFDDEFAKAFDGTDDKQMDIKARAQQAAQSALNQEVKKVLGDKRYAEYERTTDPDYRTLVQVGDRFELPRDVANRVYAMKQEAERQKLALEANANLTDDQRQRALEAIAKETQRSVAAAMGNNVFRSYYRTGGGWIRNLTAIDQSGEPIQ